MKSPEARAKIDAIKKAIQAGKKMPRIVTHGKTVIDGHHRFQAYKELGHKKIKTVSAGKTIDEARTSRRGLEAETGEVRGSRSRPSGIVSGRGWGAGRRVAKGIRRAEKMGAQPVSDTDVARMSATGVAQSLGGRKGFFGRLLGRLGLRHRARKQADTRPEGKQNIRGMEKQMKKDSEAFASPTRFSPDSRNPHHQKHTQIGGRTRQAIHRLVHGKPMPYLTLPSERYAGSAKRHDKWVASGGKKRRATELATQGRRLRGQDPRMG